jgi:hypothetical protein
VNSSLSHLYEPDYELGVVMAGVLLRIFTRMKFQLWHSLEIENKGHLQETKIYGSREEIKL